MQALTQFPADRTEALRRLSGFLPDAGRAYAARRNYDLGSGRHAGVSGLSPYLRHRLITEEEVLQAVLGRYSQSTAEKFIQEVFWRTYWKGWLEMRPTVWDDYVAGLRRAWDAIQTQAGVRQSWQAACRGETGIDAFDAWAGELTGTGYLHNHARMWFASIWIFTLRLPWELGADFFLRHLLDGDPASNTLSWRWVAGLQTRGKTYLARATNIERYTEGRFRPEGLATRADPVEGPPLPPRNPPPRGDDLDVSRASVLLLHEDDLSPGWLFDRGLTPLGSATLCLPGTGPLHTAPHVGAFKSAAMSDVTSRWSARLGPIAANLCSARDIEAWARDLGAEQIVTPYAPVGPVAQAISQIREVPVKRILRPYDAMAWPHATAGFFKFKDKIPAMIGTLRGVTAA